jgi:cyclase
MLKKRILANLVVRNGIVVQSIGFRKYLPVGKPQIAIEFLNQWGIDEIILTDISATLGKREPDYEMIEGATKKCFVPLTVGGGINSTGQIKRLMQCGADKISLNHFALANPELITEAARIFGDQCVVVCIDVIKTDEGHRIYHHATKAVLDVTPQSWAARCQELGAGEILIQSVDRDGKYTGYDLEVIRAVCERVTVPVLCCGGARTADDFINVLHNTNASAAVAANMFHFIEHSVNISKSRVQQQIPIRLETHADYLANPFDNDLRLAKKDDGVLEKMLYTKIEKEII